MQHLLVLQICVTNADTTVNHDPVYEEVLLGVNEPVHLYEYISISESDQAFSPNIPVSQNECYEGTANNCIIQLNECPAYGTH